MDPRIRHEYAAANAAGPFTHVIFDLDGTLLNTLDDLAAAGNRTCELYGWPAFPVEAYRQKVGNGMVKLVERLMPPQHARNADLRDRALADFRSYYAEHSCDRTAPYEGVIEALDTLLQAGLKLAVLTNKDHASAVPLVERFFGTSRFSCIQGRVDAFPPKPAAPVTLHVLQHLGAQPGTALYVGDSDVDVLCGHNAGMRTVGVTWGFRGQAELERAGADFIANEPAHLANIALGRRSGC